MPEPSHNAAIPLNRPQNKSELFLAFNWLALQGFGGVLAVVQRELVEKKRWLTQEQFVEDWAVAQVMPGPNVINLSLMVGGRYFGVAGALTALAGILAVPSVLVLALAALHSGVADTPVAQGALRGMGAVAAGLITATGLKMLPTLRKNALGLPLSLALAVLTLGAVAWLRWPLAAALFGIGGSACVLAYFKLGPAKSDQNLDRAA